MAFLPTGHPPKGTQSRSVELLFFSRTREGFHRRRTALDHSGHVVEVACADFLLVRHEGVTLVAGCEFRLLNHLGVVLHAFATGVRVGELEGVDSANPLEKSNNFISLVPETPIHFSTTLRPLKLTLFKGHYLCPLIRCKETLSLGVHVVDANNSHDPNQSDQ